MTDRGAGDGQPDRRSFRVDVAGVGGPRTRPGATALLALAVVVALVGGGIVSGQLFPVNRGAVTSSPADATASPAEVAPASPAAVAPSATPVPAQTPAPTPRLTLRVTSSAVDVAALVAATPRHGTGPLAFVAGRLRSTPRRCPPDARLSACVTLRIDGLRGLTVIPDDAMGSWPGDPPAGETLVLLPRDGRLVFVGSLLGDPTGIPSVVDVLARQVTSAVPPARNPSLFEADGVLIDGAGACAPGNSCLGLVATLVANPPLAGPNAGQQFARPVGVAAGAFGISPGEGAWTTGPFLLRWSPRPAAAEWQVVAREDQGSVLRVVIP